MATFQHQEGYRRGDDFNVTVVIRNRVTNKTVHYVHSLYEEIINLTFSAARDENGTQSGFGANGDTYPMEVHVHFLASMLRGSHLTFTWDFGDGEEQSVYDNPLVSHLYTQPGTYNVSVHVSNLLNSASYRITIVVQRSISPHLSLSTRTPHPSNNTFTFDAVIGNASLGDIASDACYRLFFGGDVNASVQLYFFGNLQQCARSFPVEVEGALGFLASPPLPDEEGLLHSVNIELSEVELMASVIRSVYIGQLLDVHYMTVGEWFTTLTGANIVSNSTSQFTVVTTKGPCFHPTVDIYNRNPCTPGFNCYSNDNLLSYNRSDPIVLYSTIRFNCTTSFVSHYPSPHRCFENAMNRKCSFFLRRGLNLRGKLLW